MPIQVARIINAPPGPVWAILTDIQQWPHWGPSVRAVQCADRHICKGSSGRVLTALGFWAPFVITEFEEGRYWCWRVFGIPATGHRVESIGEDRCRLLFEIPTLATPYAVVCKIAMKRIAHLSKADEV
ncbi:MAG: SRPBCC family protein [Candidatus Competibacteraceae bacterium]|jgi:hypothetical protein|nr:SRPBCC family protein [Candidatus Competibacteraceae bacterium]